MPYLYASCGESDSFVVFKVVYCVDPTVKAVSP
jgi:hypothetical protein